MTNTKLLCKRWPLFLFILNFLCFNADNTYKNAFYKQNVIEKTKTNATFNKQ